MTEEELIGNFIGFLNAGTDTTAHAITSMLWFLHHNQTTLGEAIKEIDEIIPSEQDITWDNL